MSDILPEGLDFINLFLLGLVFLSILIELIYLVPISKLKEVIENIDLSQKYKGKNKFSYRYFF